MGEREHQRRAARERSARAWPPSMIRSLAERGAMPVGAMPIRAAAIIISPSNIRFDGACRFFQPQHQKSPTEPLSFRRCIFIIVSGQRRAGSIRRDRKRLAFFFKKGAIDVDGNTATIS